MTRISATVAAFLLLFALWPLDARADCKLEGDGQFPVVMEGLRPIVTGKIKGEEVRFIADSGAFFNTMSGTAAQRLHLPLREPPFGMRVSGFSGDASFQVTTARDFTLLGYTFPSMDFVVAGDAIMNSHQNIVGLLGDNILTARDVEFDLAKGAIRLFSSHGCGNAMLAYWSKDGSGVSEMRIDPSERSHLIGDVKVNGRRMRVLFDTGTPLSFLGRRAAARAGLTPESPGATAAGAAFGIGDRAFPTWIVPVAELDVGTEQIKNTRLRIADAEMTDEDMVLGADFFLSHHIYASKASGRLFFTYNGGPVFDLRIHPGAPGPPPASAADIAAVGTSEEADRLGQAALSRRDFSTAKAYFDRAAGLAPTSADILVHRADAERGLEHLDAVKSDLDQAIKLQPDLEGARLARATYFMRRHDLADARADFDSVIAAHPSETRLPLGVAAAYSEADEFQQALDLLDAWVAAHPHDDAMANALDSRCWVRAQWNRDLDRALADCNQSLRLQRNAETFDSRGFVHLRLGQIDDAISDYNTALRLRPQTPWSLYGRSLAERSQGKLAVSDADMKLAVQLAPELPDRAAELGLSTPASPKPPAPH